MVKDAPANSGDAGGMGLIPESAVSPGGGSGNPLKCSCLEIPRTEESGRLEFMELQRAGHN